MRKRKRQHKRTSSAYDIENKSESLHEGSIQGSKDIRIQRAWNLKNPWLSGRWVFFYSFARMFLQVILDIFDWNLVWF